MEIKLGYLEDQLLGFGDQIADLIVTAPPPPYNEATSYTKWVRRINFVFYQARRLLKDNGRFAVITPEFVTQDADVSLYSYLNLMFFRYGFSIRGSIVWKRGLPVKDYLSMDRTATNPVIDTEHMMILIGHRYKHPAISTDKRSTLPAGEFARNMDSVWETNTPKKRNEIPLAIPYRLITMLANPESMVFDPWAGSGMTGVAALRAGCDFCGVIENENRYKNVMKLLESEKAQLKIDGINRSEAEPRQLEFFGGKE